VFVLLVVQLEAALMKIPADVMLNQQVGWVLRPDIGVDGDDDNSAALISRADPGKYQPAILSVSAGVLLPRKRTPAFLPTFATVAEPARCFLGQQALVGVELQEPNKQLCLGPSGHLGRFEVVARETLL
jgi:hypothetical protein